MDRVTSDIIIDISEENTDDHFTNKLNADLEKIRIASKNVHRFKRPESNSPVSMSPCNSDSETDDTSGVRRLTFREIHDSIHKYYDVKCTTEFDLLITYFKCQKQLYIQSELVSRFKMRILSIPAFIGGVSITILSPFINNYAWSGPAISCINSFVLSLVFIIYYFDFLPAIAFYMQTSKQFEKIENMVESVSDQYASLEKSDDKLEYCLSHIRSIEKKYMDLKEIMIMDIPFELRKAYPIGYTMQVFPFVKRIETNKKSLIVRLKDAKNEMRYIEWKSEQEGYGDKYRNRMEFLYETKEKLKLQILDYYNAYSCMEDILAKESRRGSIFTTYKKWTECPNPVVKTYCESIFEDD